MSRVLNIGISGKGKSTISKKMMKEYDKEYDEDGLFFILTNFPKEWKDFKLKGKIIIFP